LCANLPIVYAPLVQAAKKVKGTLYRTEQDESAYQRPSERSLYHDWARLNHSGSLAGENIEPTLAIPAKVAHTTTTEMDSLDANRIMQYHGLKGGS
jgi:hypothetical protein